MNVLFVCSRNRLRSPTAEHVFADEPGVETDSAGTDADAVVTLTGEQVAWADLVFAMERRHAAKLRRRFGRHLRGRLVVLDVPDRFAEMDPDLVSTLRAKVEPHLRRTRTRT